MNFPQSRSAPGAPQSRRRTFPGVMAGALLALSSFAAATRATPVVTPPAATHSQSGASATGVPDIHDIRPPFHIASGWSWLAAGTACCALGAAAGGWYWWRRRRLTVQMTSAELALQRLNEARVLLLPGHARAFSTAVSGIVRTYIEQRFNIAATQQTTREFLRDCLSQSSGSLAVHRNSLMEFLEHCDLAKFARWAPSLAEMEELLDSAVTFVNATVAPDTTGPIQGAVGAADRPGSVVPGPEICAPSAVQSSARQRRDSSEPNSRAVFHTESSKP